MVKNRKPAKSRIAPQGSVKLPDFPGTGEPCRLMCIGALAALGFGWRRMRVSL